MITQERLKELLNYDPVSGVFTRAAYIRGGGKVGSMVGKSVGSSQYRSVCVDGKSYLLHRLAWLYVYGKWPAEFIDHINMDKLDNRISNLREASKLLNNLNTGLRKDNTTGYKGVSFDKSRGMFVAHIRVDTKLRSLGYFNSAISASRMYQDALAKRYVEFS